MRFVHLDMLRGVAAALVVIGHIRGFVLVDFQDVVNASLVDRAVYFLCGFGHQAVIAFFALSGFLVGGKALEAMLSGRWSTANYAAARLSRLWTVVVPALVLTFLVDMLGALLAEGRGYDGAYIGILSSGPTPQTPADHSLQAFLGNLFFLQTIATPVYGSNGPLWSLAYEFWYYVMFPLAAWALLSGAVLWARIFAFGTAFFLIAFLPHHITILGLIWLAGAAAYLLTVASKDKNIFASAWYLIVTSAFVLACLVITRSGGVWQDLALGFAWSCLLPALSNLRPMGKAYSRVATGLSEISYTLYAVHFPILAAAYFVLLAPKQLQPGYEASMIMGALFALGILSATLLWWLFERNTPYVRKAMMLVFARMAQGVRHGA